MRPTVRQQGASASDARELQRLCFIVAVLTLGVMARAATLRTPLFDFHSWRQADTAAIARNFLEERFNPLYPQVDHRGALAHGYVETGLELFAFAVAALSSVTGFSPTVGRALNAILFPVAALLLFRFVRRRYGEPAGLVSLFVYSLGLPLTLFMDRAFMNESLLTLLSIVCLWAGQAYCLRNRRRDLAMLLAASILIAAIKPTFLVICGAVGGLFTERFGWRALRRWELWMAAGVTLASGALWFSHARSLALETGLTFGLDNKLVDPALLFSLKYPTIVARRLSRDILGPVGLISLIVGAVVAIRRGRHAEPLGLAAFVTYLVVVTAGNYHHNYYQLPLVPVGAVLISLGIVEGVNMLSRRYSWSWRREISVLAVILWLTAVSTFVRSASAHNWYEIDYARLTICEALRPHLAPADRVVFVNDQSPDILFCLHRKGWLLDESRSTPAHVRKLASSGASVVVARRGDGIMTALEQLGLRIVETAQFSAFRLTAPEPPPRE